MKQYLEIGKIVNTHGVRGEMKMQLWCDDIEFLKNIKTVYYDEKGTKSATLLAARPQKDMALIKLSDVDDFDKAQSLKNAVLYCNRDDAKIDEDAHFIQDVIGCYVVDIDTNDEYGKIEDVVNYGSSDIFVVKDGFKKHLIPNISDIVKEINTEYEVVKIKLMKGLFDED